MLFLKFLRYRRPPRGVDLYAQSAERIWRVASAVAIYFLAHLLLTLWPVFPAGVITAVSLTVAVASIWLPTLALFLILLAFTPSLLYVSGSLALAFAAVWMLLLLFAPAQVSNNPLKVVLILVAPIVFQDGWFFAAAVAAGLVFGTEGVPAAIFGGFFALFVSWLLGAHIVGVLPPHAPLIVATGSADIVPQAVAALKAPHFHVLLSLGKQVAPHALALLGALVVIWLVARIAAALRGDRRLRRDAIAAAVSALAGVAGWGVLADGFHPSAAIALAVLPGALLGGLAAFAIARAWISTDLLELRGVGERLSPRVSSAPKAAPQQANPAPVPRPAVENKDSADSAKSDARASRRTGKPKADGAQAAQNPVAKALSSVLRTQAAPKKRLAEHRASSPSPNEPAKPVQIAAAPQTAPQPEAVRKDVAPAPLRAVEPAASVEVAVTMADASEPEGTAAALRAEIEEPPIEAAPTRLADAPDAAPPSTAGAALTDNGTVPEPTPPTHSPPATTAPDADDTVKVEEPPPSSPATVEPAAEPVVPSPSGGMVAPDSAPPPAASAEPPAPTAEWDEIAGYEDLKLTLREIVRPYCEHSLRREFTEKGIQPVRGILLFGPRGTGKSLIARVLAGASGLPFSGVSARDFLASRSDEREENLREAFQTALAQAPSVLFLDGLEAFLPHQEPAGMSLGQQVNEGKPPTVLAEIDALIERGDVLVVAAANDPDLVDPSAFLAGRFTRVFYVPLPDADARRAFLTRTLKKREQIPQSSKGKRLWRGRERAQGRDRNEAAALEALVDACEHFTTTDMLTLVERASQTFSERGDRTTVEELTMLARLTKPSVTPRVIAHYHELAERFGESDGATQKDD